MEKLIVLDEKYGQRLIKFSVENLQALVKDRIKEGYYEYEDLLKAQDLVQNKKDPQPFVWFLTSRNDYEYEDFRVVTPDEKY